MPSKGTKRKDEIELDPKGWERFERAVDAGIKSGQNTNLQSKQAAVAESTSQNDEA